MLDQVAEPLVRLPRAGVAGVLAHRPLAPPVHVRVDAAREGVSARPAQPLLELGRHVLVGVDVLDLDARVGEAARVFRADDRRDARLMLRRGRHLSTAGYGSAGGRAAPPPPRPPAAPPRARGRAPWPPRG